MEDVAIINGNKNYDYLNYDYDFFSKIKKIKNNNFTSVKFLYYFFYFIKSFFYGF
jgi:hypothetical protein